jgi:iron complex outermembrane receptor protein
MNKRRAKLFCYCAVSILAMGLQAEAETATEPSSSDAPGLEDIVVVARRTEERLQDVPISIVAITPDQINSASITRSSDLINLVPSLSVGETTTSSGNTFSLRGIRTGVVTYFADVPTDTASVNDQLWDLGSIQALAGPQGTLFGRNSTGGTILFVPQRPTDDFGGYVEAGYGNFNAQKLNAVVNIPVSPSLKLRFGVQTIRRDGVIDNELGPDLQSQHREAYRASALFEPGDGVFSDYIVADYSYRNERPNAFITSGALSPTIGCFPVIGCAYGPDSRFGGQTISALQARQNALGIRAVASSFDDILTSKTYGIANTAQLKLFDGDLTARYIFGYRYAAQYSLANQTHLDLPIEVILNSNDGTPTYTHEAQLLGKAFDGRLNGVIGIFFLKTDGGLTQNSTSLYGDPSLPFSNANNIYNASYSDLKSRGIYTQETVSVIEGLNVTAGIRFNHDQRSQTTHSVGPAFTFFGPTACRFPAGLPGLDPATCTLFQAATDTATTYNFSIDYHFSQSLMAYVTTRRGYNAGGFNTGVPATIDPSAPQQSFGPEHLTDYEVGLKADWLVGSIPARTNLSTYLDKYQGIQRLTRGVTPAGVPFQGTANGGRAKLDGFQLESTFRLFPRLTLNVNYGYLQAKYTVGTPIFSVGNTFAQAPKNTANINLVFTQPVAVGGSLMASAGLTYQSRFAFNDTNFGAPGDFQGGYSLIDGRLAWNEVAGSNVDVDIYVKNLTNKVYALDLQDQTSLFGYTTLYADPRTYGFEVRLKFGK